MCGIVGFSGFRELGLIERMCEDIRHRGPDGDGFADFPDHGISIGVRRLAVIDIEGGEQPFKTADGRVQLVFNGEIYNFQDLREILSQAGHTFRTNSDTEVVLAAYLEWGPNAWERLYGMFAVAVVDLRGGTPELLVVRDRTGMKPMYYIEQSGKFLFASELKALLQWSGFSTEVNLTAIRDYLALRYVPGPKTMFSQVRKLPPGHCITFSQAKQTLSCWWSPPSADVQEPGMDAATADALFEDALRTAVRQHMIADVPVGAFLSGGVDSGVIVALMAENASKPVHTFSIGFPDFPEDELNRARLTAQALGTRHQTLECRAEDMQLLPDIAWSLDEPIGDAIVVPSYVLAREARREVTVALSGEGADEILGGYIFQRKLVVMENLRRWVPNLAWPLAASLVQRLPVSLLDRLFEYPGTLGVQGRQKVAEIFRSLGDDDLSRRHQKSISLFDEDEVSEIAATEMLRQLATGPVGAEHSAGPEGTPLQKMVSLQYSHWLPDLILGKLDHLTMANSLEGRTPFMDDRVVQAAARLPDRHKLSFGKNKKVLRQLARRLLPREVADSPKAAFYIPIESYLDSQGMKDILGWTLDPERLRKRGLFDPLRVKALLSSDENAGFLPHKQMFSIVMLELWFERFAPDAQWS